MKISTQFKVREMAGEHIIVMPGTYGADMTRVISLNETSLYLWNALEGREFELDTVADLLVEHYEIDRETALRDGEAWIARLRETGIVK